MLNPCYFPGGNVTNEGYYKENIPAPRADMWAKLMAVEVVESKSKPQADLGFRVGL